MGLLHILVFVFGVLIVILALLSAVRTLVLPRSAPDPVSRAVFLEMRSLFNMLGWATRARSYEQVDRIMAFYGPVSLIVLAGVWLTLVAIGYMFIFWGVVAEIEDLYHAFLISGSSLLTLGFSTINTPLMSILEFSEAALGLVLVALLIAYLPTMYSAFSRRETMVALLEVRAGSPPSAYEMIARYNRLERLDRLSQVWDDWEIWFAEVEESHTSLAALAFFRSPQADRSWVTAAGAVLDTAALVSSSLAIKRDVQAEICIRAGYIALRRIADFFKIEHNDNPSEDDPISVTRQEFDEVYDALLDDGVPLKPDREQCWQDFRGWRVNYDTVLLRLAALTRAPYAPWSSDRSLAPQRQKS